MCFLWVFFSLEMFLVYVLVLDSPVSFIFQPFDKFLPALNLALNVTQLIPLSELKCPYITLSSNFTLFLPIIPLTLVLCQSVRTLLLTSQWAILYFNHIEFISHIVLFPFLILLIFRDNPWVLTTIIYSSQWSLIWNRIATPGWWVVSHPPRYPVITVVCVVGRFGLNPA